MKYIKTYKEKLYEISEVKPDIGIKGSNSEEVVEELNELLSNHFILFVKIWNFHWTMVSKRFNGMHKFFNDLYDKYFENIDNIAERIRMLGGRPIGSLRGYLSESDLDEYDSEETPDIEDMVKMVLEDYESIIREIREILEIEELDNGTSKFMEDLIADYEKDAWMLRSHIENDELEVEIESEEKTEEMVRYHDGKTGKNTGWLSDPPTRKELERLSIDQLMMLAKRKKGSLKSILVNYLVDEKKEE